MGGGPFKPRAGDNRFRLVSECLEHPGEFKDPATGKVKPTFKWLCFILNRANKQVVPYFMPNVVYEAIEKLQLNPDYAFDEVPMPYDLTLNVVNPGKMDVVYTVLPARQNTELTVEEVALVKEAGSIKDYQNEVRKAQALKESGEHQEPTIQVEPAQAA